jgi:hypothetical protein
VDDVKKNAIAYRMLVTGMIERLSKGKSTEELVKESENVLIELCRTGLGEKEAFDFIEQVVSDAYQGYATSQRKAFRDAFFQTGKGINRAQLQDSSQ